MTAKPEGEGREETQPLIAVVGPCASGKSALVRRLQDRGYDAREITQEHSYVPTMWRRFAQPDLLIYLDVSQEVAAERRSAEAAASWWEALNRRLQDAFQHADLRIDTDDLTEREVLDRALSFIESEVG